MNAVRAIRHALQGSVPLIGFRGVLGRWQPIWWKVEVVRPSGQN